ncbi:inner membrane complex protein 1b [Plasmodium brasilianum]|uniref:Inner membrane complex protein 1b, putative n=2 Tax=Plasmodium (Plasmodium) TaxID=418103 RepID=A0A1A8W432_PLAMA|nr:inner membrane complex protein 1b, putative [Plasmodium malariae]KAI4838531.1 inner membrane complex protein 1b [Plasmodium brasilianum]SBS85911.1 inner membrane complex protein 1b, putative (IMC1b) [Plasmodium malariae]SCN12934.1 inner membrane complex protein 1b, putative [Plasmodium malariae]
MKFQNFNIEPRTPLKYGGKEGRSLSSLRGSIPISTSSSCSSTCAPNTKEKETKIIQKQNAELVEKIREVPNYIFHNKTKVIEVPELRFIDKIEYDPQVIEKIKYVPKEVTKYNIIEKKVINNIVTEKKVDVLQVQEKIRFKDQEIVEEVYHYVDKDNNRFINKQGISTENYTSSKDKGVNEKFDQLTYQYINNNINTSNDIDYTKSCGSQLPPLMEPFGPQVYLGENKTFENIFIPKVEKVVEVKKKIDIPINLPIPYIVPKPKVIDVDVPVFKFNDTYVPVPVRQRIIPKVTWSDKVYKVDCLVEKPYLVYHNIIKVVPTDSKITIREYPKGINKINTEELYEADNLALWMRVNADLKHEKDKLKKTQDSLSDHTCECSDCDTYEQNSNSELNSSQDATTIKSSNENLLSTLPLHPGHPLEITHLQNKWIKQETTRIPELYEEKFLDANRNAVFNLSTQIPREAEIEAKQMFQMQKQMDKRELNTISGKLF